MLDWLKNINKEYPDFWKIYLSKFEKKPSRYVVLSSHTSGNNPARDVIFSFGAISVINGQIVIGDSFETVILQYKYLHDNGLPNTFLIESKASKMSEPQAIEALIEFIGNAILVGHQIHLDVELINEALDRLDCGRIKNEALDVEIMFRKWKDSGDKQYSLDDLCSEFKLPAAERHTVSEEAYNMALIFLKLKSRLGIN